jgi:16S rRNA processing protein RimM
VNSADLTSIEVGRVSKAHGIRGELRVDLHWSDSEALREVDEVMLDFGDKGVRKFAVEVARPVPRGVLLKLVGVDDRNAAELLRGALVRIERTEMPALEDGEYYLVDLIGAKVVGPDGPVGDVVEVRTHPSVDTLVIRTPDGSVLEQPLVEAFVARVDTAQKLVELSSTDGLM